MPSDALPNERDEAEYVRVVVRPANPEEAEAAELWRLHQAEQLLREAGYAPAPDGTWHPAPKPEER